MRLCDLDKLICKTDKIFEKLVNEGNYQEAIGVSLVLKKLKTENPINLSHQLIKKNNHD